MTSIQPGHYVSTQLPDGRRVRSRADDPIADTIRRTWQAPTPADHATLTAWLEQRQPTLDTP